MSNIASPKQELRHSDDEHTFILRYDAQSALHALATVVDWASQLKLPEESLAFENLSYQWGANIARATKESHKKE